MSAWLSDRDNYQWLDLGNGVGPLEPMHVKVMAQKPQHCMRIFAEKGDPVGLVGLCHINPGFKTGMLWYVLGDKRRSGQGLTTVAVRAMLDVAFNSLGIESVNAWAVESNIPSVRILRRTGFQFIGRQRRCHYIDGRPVDRLLFDRLANDREVFSGDNHQRSS